MKLVEQLGQSGDLLFRWRSWLPLLLLPLFVASFQGLAYPLGSHRLDLLWEISCFAVSALGLAVRVVTVGKVNSRDRRSLFVRSSFRETPSNLQTSPSQGRL